MKQLITILLLILPYFNFAQYKIAFGSCMDQNKELGILDTIVKNKVKDFIFLGDNLYIDSYVQDSFVKKYQALANNSHYQLLDKKTNVFATWDDHDFGANDANKDYPLKAFSRNQFIDFFYQNKEIDFSDSSAIYHSFYRKHKGLKIQYILLDTRSNLDSLCRFKGKLKDVPQLSYWPQYAPCEDSTKSILGENQWNWLKNELLQKADVRIICSSIQFAHAYNGHESWNNLPFEKAKMLHMLKETAANGVVFISGDVHYGEISLISSNDFYPLYDVTSSGLSNVYPTLGPGENRVGNGHTETNFGMIEIKRIKRFNRNKLYEIKLQLKSEKNEVLEEIILTRSQLSMTN